MVVLRCGASFACNSSLGEHDNDRVSGESVEDKTASQKYIVKQSLGRHFSSLPCRVSIQQKLYMLITTTGSSREYAINWGSTVESVR